MKTLSLDLSKRIDELRPGLFKDCFNYKNSYIYETKIPRPTLEEILEVLPGDLQSNISLGFRINYNFYLIKDEFFEACFYNLESKLMLKIFRDESPTEAAGQILIWVLENHPEAIK